MRALKSRRSYVLLTLGALFTVGAAVRFIPNNLASADETRPASAAEQNAGEAADEHGKGHIAPLLKTGAIDEVCFTAETAAALAEDQKRMEALDAELTEKSLSLQEREQEVERRTAELQSLQDTLEKRWTEMQTSSSEDLKRLSQMYGSMKPDQAAQIFDQMDPNFAAGFLRLMRAEQAGMIMAGMETRKAYAVSLKLASQNEDIRDAASAN